ncbi:hypothetical protein KY284_020469 [Solanum tuberosum]|nr:hypothetical protein KY284_020469 [Solanum tuberosum]
MPGTLKLNVVASIYYNSHKPYNWFRSFTTGTGISNSSIPAAAAHTRYSLYIHSPSRRKFLGRLGHRYADFAVRSISTTRMGPTPDHKEEDLRREKPSLPIPSKSEKLLTLPMILTIDRVAVVPLLVTSKFLSYNVDLITGTPSEP